MAKLWIETEDLKRMVEQGGWRVADEVLAAANPDEAMRRQVLRSLSPEVRAELESKPYGECSLDAQGAFQAASEDITEAGVNYDIRAQWVASHPEYDPIAEAERSAAELGTLGEQLREGIERDLVQEAEYVRGRAVAAAEQDIRETERPGHSSVGADASNRQQEVEMEKSVEDPADLAQERDQEVLEARAAAAERAQRQADAADAYDAAAEARLRDRDQDRLETKAYQQEIEADEIRAMRESPNMQELVEEHGFSVRDATLQAPDPDSAVRTEITEFYDLEQMNYRLTEWKAEGRMAMVKEQWIAAHPEYEHGPGDLQPGEIATRWNQRGAEGTWEQWEMGAAREFGTVEDDIRRLRSLRRAGAMGTPEAKELANGTRERMDNLYEYTGASRAARNEINRLEKLWEPVGEHLRQRDAMAQRQASQATATRRPEPEAQIGAAVDAHRVPETPFHQQVRQRAAEGRQTEDDKRWKAAQEAAQKDAEVERRAEASRLPEPSRRQLAREANEADMRREFGPRWREAEQGARDENEAKWGTRARAARGRAAQPSRDDGWGSVRAKPRDPAERPKGHDHGFER